ncbi:MAG: carboxylesterase family protein, partial [bacterium]
MVETKYGLVEGIEKDGCTMYLGIPFAKPPVGKLTFKHPQEPKPWDVADAMSARDAKKVSEYLARMPEDSYFQIMST